MIPKFKYIRSKALMAMYRTIPCQNDSVDNGTVVGAHSNQQKHGKGRGVKASDEFCASLCYGCHDWLDFGSASREVKTAMWDKAHYRTVKVLTARYGEEYLRLVRHE